MMQIYLTNILIFCAILLLLAVTVAIVQMIIIFIDVRRSTREINEVIQEGGKKVKTVISLIDVIRIFKKLKKIFMGGEK